MGRPTSQSRLKFSFSQKCRSCGSHFEEFEAICPYDGALLVDGVEPNTLIAERYSYISALGNGGMGLIIKAHDVLLSTDVAIKMLLRADKPSDIARFTQEIRAIRRLSHPNIVSLYDFGVLDNEYPYMVMELIDGEDLSTLLSKSGALSEIEAVRIFDQICDVMQYAHETGILHRDLKPSNVMVTDKNLNIKVVDFGIAKILDNNNESNDKLTQTGQVLGSPRYMSPEQSLGKPVDMRTDTYSAGCLLYHMLTGSPPIIGDSSLEVLFNNVNYVPPRLSEASLGKKFSRAVEDVVEKSIAKNPSDRYQNFTEFQDDIRAAIRLGQPPQGNKLGAEAPSVASNKTGVLASPKVTSSKAIMLGLFAFVVFSAVATTFLLNAPKPASDRQFKQADVAAHAQTVHPRIENQILDNSPVFDIDASAETIARADLERKLAQPGQDIELSYNDHGLPASFVRFLVTSINLSQKRNIFLSLSDTAADDDAMKELAKLSPNHRLRKLNVSSTKVTAKGLETISKFTSLECLDISHLKGLNFKSLACLSKLRLLNSLTFQQCYDDINRPVDVSFLAKLKNLESINASSNLSIGDKDIYFFCALPKLKRLVLNLCNVDDDGLLHLCRAQGLESLSIAGIRLTDRSISKLQHFPKLQSLFLMGQPITDKGLAEFSKMHEQDQLELSRLNLKCCTKITAAGVVQLRKDMPNCTIEF